MVWEEEVRKEKTGRGAGGGGVGRLPWVGPKGVDKTSQSSSSLKNLLPWSPCPSDPRIFIVCDPLSSLQPSPAPSQTAARAGATGTLALLPSAQACSGSQVCLLLHLQQSRTWCQTLLSLPSVLCPQPWLHNRMSCKAFKRLSGLVSTPDRLIQTLWGRRVNTCIFTKLPWCL